MLKRVLSVVLVLVLWQAFFVQSAAAEDDQPKKEKDYKWAYFAALPVYYFGVEIPLHESSHALGVALDPNWNLTKFQPYPHYTEDGSRFVFGSMTMTCKSTDACEGKIGPGLIATAPYIMATTIFTVSDVLLSNKVVEPTSVAGRVMYFAGMVVPWWDLSYNAIWAIDGSDAAYIAENFEIPRWSVMAVGASVSAVGIWRLWKGYKEAFPKQNRSRVNEPNLVVVPISDTEKVGISIRMRF